jgi:hypothetical protein
MASISRAWASAMTECNNIGGNPRQLTLTRLPNAHLRVNGYTP